MEMEISQSEIDAMTEGAEKKRMQRELDNRKEIQSLERQKEDMIQAVIQAEKEIFDAQEELKAKENNKYQKKTFDSSKVDTGKISSIWDTIIEIRPKSNLMIRYAIKRRLGTNILSSLATINRKGWPLLRNMIRP